MVSKEQLKTLITHIKNATGKSQEAISVAVGYKPTTLAEILSKGSRLDQAYRRMELTYKDALNKSTSAAPVGRDEAFEALQAKYIKYLEDDKAYFKDLLKSSLVSLVGQVRDVGTRQKAAGEIVLRSLERLEKKKSGDLVREADMRMVQIEKEAERRGSDAVQGKQYKET